MRYGLVASVLNSRSKATGFKFQYWRIYIEQVWGSSLAAVSDMEFFSNGNTTDLTTANTGSIASSENNTTTWIKEHAFDDIPSTGWAAANSTMPGNWLGYMFDDPVQLTGLSLTPRTDSAETQFPKEFYLQYSSDGIVWYDYAYFITNSPVLGVQQIVQFPATDELEIQDLASMLVYGVADETDYLLVQDVTSAVVYGNAQNNDLLIQDVASNTIYAGA